MPIKLGLVVFLVVVASVVCVCQGEQEAPGVCVNGQLAPDGTCICKPCWTGNICNSPISPKFLSSNDEVTISASDYAGKTFYSANDSVSCEGDCSTCIKFSIARQDGDSLFHVDRDTGDLSLSGELGSLHSSFQIQIGVSGPDSSIDTMTLTVHVERAPDHGFANNYMSEYDIAGYGGESYLELGPSHHRVKRADITLPDEIVFTLTKTGVNHAVTSMKVGIRIQFKLEILFPSGNKDIQVELFAPDGNDIIMMLCNVVVTVGSNLGYDGTADVQMESLDSSSRFDRAIIALGVVSNSESDLATEEPSKIVITYEAVMVDNAATSFGDIYWVSAGAEYNNDDDVWVGQASFQAVDDPSANTDTPTVDITGPATLEVGQTGLYSVEMYLPYPLLDVELDVFAPVDTTDALRVCGLQLVNISEAYKCGMNNPWDYTAVGSAEGNTKGFRRMTLNMGKVINKLAREGNDPSQVIRADTLVCAQDNDGIIGNSYKLGVTLQMGLDVIWTGHYTITVATKTYSSSSNPTFNYNFLGNNIITQTNPVIVQLDIELPEQSTVDFVLEFLAPYNDSAAVYQVCAVSVVKVGDNVACFDSDISVTYSASGDGTASYMDRAVTSGRITNVGPWGWTNGSPPADVNSFTLNVIFKATDHALAVENSVHNALMGMYVGTEKLHIGSIPITMGADQPADAIDASNTPAMGLSYVSGSSTAGIGDTVKLLLDVTTARNTTYIPFKVEFIMPNNTGEATLQICKVELHSAGRNNPCIVDKGIENTVNYVSSFDDGILDRAELNLPSLCNIEQVNDTTEDHFVLSASARIRDHSSFSTEPQVWLSAGVMYSPSNLWVGQASLNVDVNASPVPVNTVPHIGVEANNGNQTHVPANYPSRHLVRIKLAPNDSSPLSLQVLSTSGDLSVCHLRVVRLGSAYPCTDLIDNTVTGIPILTQDFPSTMVLEARIDLGVQNNLGAETFIADDRYDENSIEVEVTTKVVSTSVVDLEEHKFELVLSYDSSTAPTLTTATATVTLTATPNMADITLTAPSSAALTVGSISGSDDPLESEDLTTIVKAESKRLVLTVDTVFNTTSHLTITMETPVGHDDDMEILYLGLLDAEDNLPCLSHSQGERTMAPRSTGIYDNIATLNLEFVCNVGYRSEGNNSFRLEGFVRLLKTDSVSQGTTLTMKATVTAYGESTVEYTVDLLVGDETAYTDVYGENITITSGTDIAINESIVSLPVSIQIGKVVTIPMSVSIPPYTSSQVWVDAAMPVNTTAVLTILDMKLTGSGPNVPNLVKYMSEFTTTQTRHEESSQIIKWEFYLGIVSNGGFSYRGGTNVTGDDDVHFEVTIQMADSVIATDTSLHSISFGLHVARFILILEAQTSVVRSDDVVEFNITSGPDLLNSNATYMEWTTVLSLSTDSNAEGQDTTLMLFVPRYMVYGGSNITSLYKTIVSETNVSNCITLNFGPLFFTDEIHIGTILREDEVYQVPSGITGLNSVFSYEVLATNHGGIVFTSQLDYFNFSVTTTPSGGDGCVPAAMGMESGTIQNCQLSSSRDSLAGFEAKNARKGKNGWSPFVHGGLVRYERHLQVDFERPVFINEITLTQMGGAKVTRIGVKHSNDGEAWVEYPENTVSVDTGVTESSLSIPNPQTSRFLRVLIKDTEDDNARGSYTFEFIGCAQGAFVSQRCSTEVASNYVSDFSMTSFITISGTVYVCDSVQSSKGIQQKCFSSSDAQTWQHLDPRVGAMVGYDADPEKLRLYAVSANGLHYMSSGDGGLTWATSYSDDVTLAKASPTFKAAQVPAQVDFSGDPYVELEDGTYKASVVGLKHHAGSVWTKVLSWQPCCPA